MPDQLHLSDRESDLRKTEIVNMIFSGVCCKFLLFSATNKEKGVYGRNQVPGAYTNLSADAVQDLAHL
jgi:hypothetical protein